MSQPEEKSIHTFLHSEGAGWIVALDKALDSIRLDGTSWAYAWKPVEVSRVASDCAVGDQLTDFASGFCQWNMNDRARQMLEPDLARYGEFLPLKCGEEAFWTFNVTNFVDALDVDASNILWASDSGRLLLVEEPVFFPQRLSDDLMFKVPNWRTGKIYVSDQFVQLIHGYGLTGLQFRRVWPRLPEGRAPWTD